MRLQMTRHLVCLGCLAAVLVPFAARAQESSAERGVAIRPVGGQRWAVLIGVDKYDEIPGLKYCGEDMQALKAALVGCGFPVQHVLLLSDQADDAAYRPTKANIESRLKAVLSRAEKGDLVVVAFSGHGVHLNGTSYLCPSETRLANPQTLVPLDGIYDSLKNCSASLKLVLVDACRNDPLRSGARAAAPVESTEKFLRGLQQTPEGILLLTSCAPGQVSREDAELGHGIFMHHLLLGLAGGAADSEGRVSLLGLADYANRQTRDYVRKKFDDLQTPAIKAELLDNFVLGIAGVTRIDDVLEPFGKVAKRWRQVGQLQNNRQTTERTDLRIQGDFTLQFTVTAGRGPQDRGPPYFELVLVGASGGDDLSISGCKTNSWAGVDTWEFHTPVGLTRKGLIPDTRTLTLRRKGELCTLSADSVFNPDRNPRTIAEFATGNSKTFSGVRLTISGPNMTPKQLRIQPSP